MMAANPKEVRAVRDRSSIALSLILPDTAIALSFFVDCFQFSELHAEPEVGLCIDMRSSAG